VPYYIYRIDAFPVKQLQKLEQHPGFRDASARAKVLRTELGAGDRLQVKVIFAENELQAEDLLNQVREAEPMLGDDY